MPQWPPLVGHIQSVLMLVTQASDLEAHFCNHCCKQADYPVGNLLLTTTLNAVLVTCTAAVPLLLQYIIHLHISNMLGLYRWTYLEDDQPLPVSLSSILS